LAVEPRVRPSDQFGVSTPQTPTSDDPPFAMRLLAAGVPLLLLLDLAAPGGPDSEVIADTERAGYR
jgi:hypothetical protein